MKYRKKPVVIEAFKYDGDLKDKYGNYYVPKWAVDAYDKNVLFYDTAEGGDELYVRTLEGIHHVSAGDYVIMGVVGEIYPCKPDIFEQTYEEVFV